MGTYPGARRITSMAKGVSELKGRIISLSIGKNLVFLGPTPGDSAGFPEPCFGLPHCHPLSMGLCSQHSVKQLLQRTMCEVRLKATGIANTDTFVLKV